MARGEVVMAVDTSGRANLELAKETWRDVVARYEGIGVRLQRPVSLVIEEMPIMGATQSTSDGHRLHVSLRAVGSGMLDGLMAHEMGHMVLTERRHPSHTTDVHRRAFETVEVPAGERRAFGAVARGAVNHVEDIYADDLAIEVIGRDRDIARFFSEWVRNSARPGDTRLETLGNGVTVAFALGNMARHGIRAEPAAVAASEAFAKVVGLASLPWFVTTFRDLPKTDETEPVEGAIRAVLSAIASEGLR
ncbi:MAG TPA: DUF5781 family protein [Thermoplasmata archaeon]|nr:DUF5781 family protein [Thermoplasmata archaeon]